MDDLAPLTIVCKHLKQETRDDIIARLRKQKQAAHASNARLRKKVRELELAVRLVSAVWVAVEQHNDILNRRVNEIIGQATEIDT